jgi:hypothetical protein
MAGRRADGGSGPGAGIARRARRVLADDVFAAAVALLALLLLCWPFVRTPPLDDASALGFVFAVWGAFIAVLFLAMRARRAAPERDEP